MLNGRMATAGVTGEALASVAPDRPYKFHFDERSSGSHLTADATIARPFAFSQVTASFTAQGDDLRDLHYLVGVRLPDTVAYRLKGRFERDGMRFMFRDLDIQAGESDLTGSITTDASTLPHRLETDLHSKRVRLADVGKRAAGRAEETPGPRRIFPEWPFSTIGIRLRDAQMKYRADTMELGPLVLHDVSTPITIEGAVLTADSLQARTTHGAGRGRIVFDARVDRPRATAELDITGLELGELMRGRGPTPPATGQLDGTLQLEALGPSLHDLAASSTGRMHVTMSGGEMSNVLAALADVDLRALGLVLARDGDRVAVRCAVLDARAESGKVTIQRLIVDTEASAIVGEGSVDLHTEALDIVLRGQPKRAGLRLRTPLRLARYARGARTPTRAASGRSAGRGGGRARCAAHAGRRGGGVRRSRSRQGHGLRGAVAGCRLSEAQPRW